MNDILMRPILLVYREQFKADYEALQTRLSTLPNQLTHDVMVGLPIEQCLVCVWVWSHQ